MFRALSRYSKVVAMLAVGFAVSLIAIDVAEARRSGGGFGSRGSRTFQTPAVTRTAPSDASPINKSMTPRTQADQKTGAQPQTNAQRPGGLFGGFGRSLMGGLLLGGLFGMLMGQGFGGMMGMLGMLLQVGLIIGAIMLAMRFFSRRKQQPGLAGAGAGAGQNPLSRHDFGRQSNPAPAFKIPSIGGSATAAKAQTPAQPVTSDIQLQPADFDRFEQLLTEIQTAYGEENYPALRRLTTPEAMSYLAEELGENATNGVRNSVKDVKLLQGDLSEAWREGVLDYATLAMRYSSIDAMLDRNSGDVVDGDAVNPTETTELWTFVRKTGTDWQLSAIQAA